MKHTQNFRSPKQMQGKTQFSALDDLKVAIVCDWLTNMGGAERVVLEMHKMFPDAPIFTSLYNKEKMPLFKGADVRTSFIQKIPFARKKHQLFPLLREHYFERLKLDEYDLVLSSSGAEAKAIKIDKSTIHINYCHSPTHYYWIRTEEYIRNPGFGLFNPVMRAGLKLLIKHQRKWDYRAAQRPRFIIANSNAVKERIKKYYNRDSTVIYPPVDVKRFKTDQQTKRSGFLIAGRQVHYKRFDLAVAACTEIGVKLTVIGNGPEHGKLVKMAGSNVTFVTNVDDDEIVKYFQSAQAFIFPGEEDFGIVAVEAMAAGTPVIAYDAGGAKDTVLPGETGILFDDQSTQSLVSALKSFKAGNFDPNKIREHADKFSLEKFQNNLVAYLNPVIK